MRRASTGPKRSPIRLELAERSFRVMRQFERKVRSVSKWLSTVSAVESPKALVLRVCRTRPPNGFGLYARSVRRLFPAVSLRPRALRGMVISIRPSDPAELVIYEEMFVDRVYDLSLLPFTPETVVDCGAYQGHFTLLAKARYPSAKFIAFEPHPDNYAIMRGNFARNGVEVDSRPVAVSNRAGNMSFVGNGCGGRLTSGRDAVCARTVQLANLSAVLPSLSSQRLLLKVDIEGEEDRIVPELVPALPASCAVFFEWHHGLTRFDKIKNLFEQYGFVVHCSRTRLLEQDNCAFVDAAAMRHDETDSPSMAP